MVTNFQTTLLSTFNTLIKESKLKLCYLQAGCGIKPKTPVEPLSDLASLLDVLLIMTVEPGFGGQSFMADMMPKVR